MEQENYKERMLDELLYLTRNTTKLSTYMDSLKEKTMSEVDAPKIELMRRQLEFMHNYQDILKERILLEMK